MEWLFVITLILLAYFLGPYSPFDNAPFKQRPQERAAGQQKRRPMIQDDGVRNLVQQGDIDEAITVYQKFTGVDSYTARVAIEEMAREARLQAILPDDALIQQDDNEIPSSERRGIH